MGATISKFGPVKQGDLTGFTLKRVVMLVRGDSLAATMSPYLIQFRTRVGEVHGEDRLESVSIVCDITCGVDRVPANSLFVFIGAEPHTGWLNGTAERNKRGFILAGPDLLKSGKRPQGWTLERDPGLLETNIPGAFAVGDVRYGSVKRVASGHQESWISFSLRLLTTMAPEWDSTLYIESSAAIGERFRSIPGRDEPISRCGCR